jgi:hypothetical protein
MGRLGFEPRTNRLKAECSTAELATRVQSISAHEFIMYHKPNAKIKQKLFLSIYQFFGVCLPCPRYLLPITQLIL